MQIQTLNLTSGNFSEQEKQKSPQGHPSMLRHGMKRLIDNVADVTAVDNTKTDGTSLLHMATQGGHVLIVNYLLSLRALDVNCRNIHEA